MIEKLLGLSDKSIIKKSTYYGYLLGAIMGVVGIVSGIGSFIFRYSDTYKGMILFQKDNIEYLKTISHEIKDAKLLDISELYALNVHTISDMYQSFTVLIIAGGLILISNFILVKKLRNRLPYREEKEEK